MLRVLQALPWSLAIGDIDENLAALLEEEDVHDLTAHKILQLLRLGWNRQQIKDAIMLFRDVHWSTLPCRALPCPALPCPPLPCPALPCPAVPSSSDPCRIEVRVV